MRAISLAVTGLSIAIIACSSGGTSVQPIERTPVASVAVSVPSTLLVGQTQRGTATPLDKSGSPLSNRTVTWGTSAAQVATVDNSGLIAAVAPGNALITAASEGVSSQANLIVAEPSPAPVSTVSVSLAAGSLSPGQTTQASAIPRDANNNVLAGRSIAWTSSNTGVATVNASGVVSAVAVGSAQIIATSESKSGSATLTVAAPPPVPVASVSVTLAASSLTPGQTTQATATTRDASNNVLTGRAITWSSSNTGVATVSSSGLVTAIAVGSVQIVAACEGKSGAATLTVNNPTPIAVASVSVTLANSSLTPGLTTQATATTRDANNNVLTGRTIAWNSSNNALATVSASGLVTAVAVGSVQITATSEGKTGSANLAVVSPPPPSPGNPNEPSGMSKITAREFNAINEDPNWQDEDPAIIADDPTAPSPSKVWRAQYPTGFAAGS
ncbi:MAG TPA: Ig-like domain-containing protein, partial [Gemmatimonadaceae bacterium]|nr:Ig-like domain-containing protein [Gemmatimonadaceae bacterium]